MGVVAATALPMALYRPVLFLALVAVFSFYLTFSGYRVLKLKNLARGGSAKPIDWIAACLGFAVCACLATLGWFRPAAVQNMGVVAIVLGLVGMRATGMDLYSFVHKPTEKMFWWYSHLSKFIGSYVAAWTAFSTATLSHVFLHAGNYFVAVADFDRLPGGACDHRLLQTQVCGPSKASCSGYGSLGSAERKEGFVELEELFRRPVYFASPCPCWFSKAARWRSRR